jgi:hypothetical protein
MEVCNRSALCEDKNSCCPYNLKTFLLFAEPTRSAHGRVGATGSVRQKRIRCKSDIDQLEKNLTAPQKLTTSVDLSAKTNTSHHPRQDDTAPVGSSDASGTLYLSVHDNSGSARGSATAASPQAAATATTSMPCRIPTETASLRQDAVSA